MPKPTKKFSFTRPEFLYVSEHRAFIELHDSFIRRYVAAVVLPRLSIDTKNKFIKVADDGNGIDVTENEIPSTEPSTEPTPATRPISPPKPSKKK
jgi:hypothetical protein